MQEESLLGIKEIINIYLNEKESLQ